MRDFPGVPRLSSLVTAPRVGYKQLYFGQSQRTLDGLARGRDYGVTLPASWPKTRLPKSDVANGTGEGDAKLGPLNGQRGAAMVPPTAPAGLISWYNEDCQMSALIPALAWT